QREQAGQRGAQLVGDGGGEARAELLVGREVTRLAEVEERLPAAVDLVGDLEGRAPGIRPEHVLRKRRPLGESLDRLPSAPARGEHAAFLVEDDDGLAALLEQPAAAFGGEPLV